MTDFEKALEAAASVFANCRNGKFAAVNSDEWIRSFEGHKEGARWSRQFTVAEVCKMLRDNYINGGKGMADFIEQHFKDRGDVG